MQACRWLALVLVASSSAAQSAELALELGPRQLPRAHAQHELVRDGDTLFLAGEVSLHAFDADTLAPRWNAGPPPGWDQLAADGRAALLRGLALERTWTAPAVSAETVVAAWLLATPRAREQQFGGLQLQGSLPDRRLFGLDRATGVVCWNHAPRPGAPKERSFAERMTLLTPPIALDGRIVVACTSDTSSVDYQLAAYDARGGALLWKTFVLRGQIARGAFGFQMRDHPTPPLVAGPDGASVLALTGLGALACVELESGLVRWISAYPAVSIPRAHLYGPVPYPGRWFPTAPRLVGDVILVAPPDSRALCAFDARDGSLLWELGEADQLAFCGRLPDQDELVGADDEHIALGGRELGLLRVRGGLRAPQGFELVWSRPVEEPLWTRARWQEGLLYLPVPGGLLPHDLTTGEPRPLLALDAELGYRIDGDAITALGRSALTRQPR
jgi:outer membrane protein assembly factor BamB